MRSQRPLTLSLSPVIGGEGSHFFTRSRWIAVAGVLTLITLLASWLALADVAVPPLKARVTDLTSTLTSSQTAALEQKLAALEQRKGGQLAVLIVPATQPETIEQYATRVFDQWKLGRKGVDDGALLVIAKNDRRLRIEVGYGLEGVIPDAIAKRVIDEEIVPLFKQGDFYGGVSAGAERIAKLIEGEPMPAPQPRSTASWDTVSHDAFIIGLIAIVVLSNVLHSLLGRGLASGVVGVAAGTIAYFLAGFLVAVILGLVAFFVSLFAGTGSGHRGGWSSDSGWSSRGSWSSSDSGGFSGGGGSSGGGGASGSW